MSVCGNERLCLSASHALADRTSHAKWMAPEVMNGGPLTVESDIWAFGVLVWEVYNKGATPYASGLLADCAEMRVVEHMTQLMTHRCMRS